MGPTATVIALLISFSATLNPDGSGKGVFEIRLKPVSLAPGAEKRPVTLDQAKAYAQTLLHVDGIEAWSDVTAIVLPDGASLFKGTAYFKKLETVPLLGGPRMITMEWKADPRGGMALSFDPARGKVIPKAEPMNISDPDVLAAVERKMAAWRSNRDHMKSVYANVKLNHSFKFPAPVAEVSGFAKDEDGKTVRLTFDGMKCFEALDTAMQDAAFVARCMQAKIDPTEDWCDPVLQEKIFGAKGPWAVRVTGEMKPQFDYAAEVKAAKDAFPKIDESLKPAPAPAPVPAPAPAPVEPKANEAAPSK
jgi:hypothetical protein